MSNMLPYQNSLSSWLNNLKSDDIDGGLAADFDGSLSGLGVELGSSTYNMSEALLALPVFKQEQYDQGYQYVLTGPTSPATKMNEETLTYLNQGQSYEIKLKKFGELENMNGKMLKSIVRVVFHERRLQYMEKDQLDTWRMQRPGERILDIDIPLSYGLIEVKISERLNAAEFVWDPHHNTGIYIKVHCISTEFTPKKHGGEKGVPFRIQVETYLHDVDTVPKLLHGASCQVKVFKPKGADRKQKTDREKIEKRSEAEKEKYQPSYECTVLTEIPIDQVRGYLDQLRKQQEEEPGANQKEFMLGSAQKLKGSPKSSTKGNNVRNFKNLKTEPRNDSESSSSQDSKASATTAGQLLKQLTIDPPRSIPECRATCNEEITITLTAKSTSENVTQWLQQNRFSNFIRVFQNFSGADLLRLSRDDLIQICGLADGIRLDNSLQSKTVRPKLTIFVYQEVAPGKESAKRHSSGSTQECSPPSQPVTPSHTNPQISPKAATPSPTTPTSLVTSTKAVGFTTNFSQHPAQSAPCPDTPHTSEAAAKTPEVSREQHCEPEAVITLRRRRSSGEPRASTASKSPPVPVPSVQKSKRQYRDDNDDSEDETLAVSYSKKQRTRNLQLSRKAVYHAVFLEHLNLAHLKEKMAALFSIQPAQIIDISVQWSSGILVLATDSVVQNFVDQTRYLIEALQDEDYIACYRICLQQAQQRAN